MLLNETQFVVERINGLMVTHAHVTQAAFASVQVKGGDKLFKEVLEGLGGK